MKTALRLAGVALTVIFIVFAFFHVQWSAFFAALGALQPGYVALSTLALLASMALRSIRWYLVTGLPRSSVSKVWEASCAGYLGIIYPARAGEVLRMLRLRKLTGMGAGLAIGSAVVDRVLDGLGLCFMLLVFVYAWKGGMEQRQGLLGIAFLFLAAASFIAVFVVSGHRLGTLFQRIAAFGKLGVRLNQLYEQSLEGLQVLRSPKQIFLAIFCQAAVSMFDILACWLLLRAFGWGLPLIASVVVFVYLTAALSLPSTPGYVGMYQAAALFALRPFGINFSSAVAYGTVLQVVTLILFIGVGLWAMGRQRIRDQNVPGAI